MAETETKDKGIFQVFFKGLSLYVMNLGKFMQYMAFPVIGQLIGIFMTLGIVFWYSAHLPHLITRFHILDNFSTMIISTIALAIPGLVILTKAFWDYMIAYSALNSMAEATDTTGKVYDFPAHNNVVYSRIVKYLALWLTFGIYTLIASIPVFWLAWIFFIYFILIFQVFTFEENLSVFGYFKKSFNLIKGKFAQTFALMTILVVLTYWILAQGINVIFDLSHITDWLTNIFSSWCNNLPLDYINNKIPSRLGTVITSVDIAKMLINQIAMLLAVGFTLPLRCICWTLWYKNLNNGYSDNSEKVEKKSRKKKSKTPSFKIEKRGIDPEIIRRARMEDDEY